MAIYYVPDEAGWNDTSLFGAAAQLRLKLTADYDGALNRSALTVTLQAKLPSDSGNYVLGSESTVTLNGSALFTGGDCSISFGGTQSWYDLTDDSTGDPAAWTAAVDHAEDGTASVSFGVHLRLYKTAELYLTWFGKNVSQAIDQTRQYLLTLSPGTGCSITAQRGGETLADGALLSHGDVLTLGFAAASGYVLLAHTVNGESFPSGGSLTVAGPVTAAATARRLGLMRYDTGSALVRCRVLLDTGSALVPVRLFLDRGDRIAEVGT